MPLVKRMQNSRWWVVMVLILLAGINIIASKWHTRIDLTAEKRFTLSESTRKLLRKIKEPIVVDVFLQGNLPSGFRKLSTATADLLAEYKEIAGNKIRFRFLSPDENIEGTNIPYADTLSAMGVLPINLTSQVKQGQQQQFVYPVALVQQGDRTLPVELYKGKSPLINFQELSSAEAMLEYQLSNAIAKINTQEKPIVAYTTGNGEPMGYDTYDMVENVLKPNYRFYTFDLKQQPVIPTDFKTLLLVKPSLAFTDEEKLKLDQYVMQGGKLLIFLDKLNAEMDSLQVKNEVIAYDRELRISDQLFRYGARINSDLLMDLQCDYLPFDVNGNGQFELLPWNYFPVIASKSNHPVNKNLGFVAGQFVNSIDTVEAAGIRKTILLSSSANARLMKTPALISGKENSSAPEDDKFKQANIPVAVLLEGKFGSFFTNRLSQAMNDSLQFYGQSFLPQCISDNKMIIVSDGDMVLNAVVKGDQPIPMGMNQFTYGSQREFPFANRDFLQNCLEYLVNQHDLSDAKAKDYTARLLDTKKVNASMQMWQVINLVVPVCIVVIFAFIFQWWRRRKYTTR